MPRGSVQFAQIQVGLSERQQAERASRPRLSEADDTVLKLVLRALGEEHFLSASSVCRAWKEAYSTHVQQSPLTCCKFYLQDASMWSYTKELGLHESIPAILFGQYGCDSALDDKLAAALDKLKPQETPEVTPEAAPSATTAAEASESERECSSSTDCDSEDDLNNPMLPLIGITAELRQAAVRRAEVAAAKRKASKEADLRAGAAARTAVLEAERKAKEAKNSAKLAAERIVKIEAVCLADTVAPIVTGAAKAGRYTVCFSILAKLPRQMTAAYDKLMTSIVRALANCAAKCKDVATFNRVLRALLLVSHAVMIPEWAVAHPVFQ
jgi:hypothetical protein